MQEANRLLSALPPDVLAAIRVDLKEVTLEQGTIIADPGEDIHTVYFPRMGIVSLLVILEDGSEIETSMVGCDGVVGASQAVDDKVSINRIVVRTKTVAAALSRDRARDLYQSMAPFQNILASYSQFSFADAQQTGACNAAHTVEGRVARWLLRMRDLVGDDFALTQEQLAALLAVRRTSVSSVANKLKATGVVDFRRGQLHIVDAAALNDVACECHRAVQANYERLIGLPWPRLEHQPRKVTASHSVAP